MNADETSLFNVIDTRGALLCPACGFDDGFNAAFPPYGPQGGIIGRGICHCCLWEPGFDDDPMASSAAAPTILASIRAYRAAWIASGYAWRGQPVDPAIECAGEQRLASLLSLARHLA
jgi:hypothetical protein